RIAPPVPPPSPILQPIKAESLPAPVIRSGQRPGTSLSQAVAAGEVSQEEIESGQLRRAPETPRPPTPRYSLYPGSLGASKRDTVAADSTVTVPDTAGLIALDGHLDLASKERSYDLTARAYLFNANAVTTKAPATTITATAAVKGRGTKPETMKADIAANLTG